MDINDEEYSMTVKSIYEYISKSDKMYYLEISETNNYIRNDFEATKKNELYFCKKVLNNEIKCEKDLIKNIERIGET